MDVDSGVAALGRPLPGPRAGRDDGDAELILAGGRIFTADAARSWAEAIAVRDGRIAAVGGSRAVMRLAGSATRVIQLRGRTLTPGFQDAHVHPAHGGLARMRCELHDVEGLDRYLEVIGAYAASHPDEPWILGGGWSLADFPGGLPRRADLDRVVPDRPVYLPNRDVHDAWVNSRALELAGITRDTLDPPDGRIARDADGAPLGTLHEGAMNLVGRLVPPTSPGEMEAALLDAQRYLHSLGITAWQDAWVTAGEHDAYVALARSGRLTARVVGALWWERDQGLEQIDTMVELRRHGTVGRYAPTSVKLMVDGIVENHSAAMLQPYLDPDGRVTDNAGHSFIEPEMLTAAVTRLDALGFQPHFHALGDRAVREALDAVEEARRANGWSDTRPHLAHLQAVHPDDLPRFRKLGALANNQAYWAVHNEQMDELTLPSLAPEVAARQYPLRSLRAHGATMVMGSDWPVSTPDPFLQMEVALARCGDAKRGAFRPFMPQETIELSDALTAFTAGSAHANHLDATGTLAPGMLADLAVLDRDLFDPGAGAIGGTRVVGTFLEGEVVHEAADLEG
jgi:predicted amidohydrolase YtcJ